MDDRSSAVSKAEQAERRLADLVSQICSLVNTTEDAFDYTSSASIEHVIRKVCNVVHMLCCFNVQHNR